MNFFTSFNAFAALVAFTVPTSALNYNVSVNSEVHMAYAGATGMTISWNTFNQLSNPTVMYGLSPDAMTLSASSTTSVTYNTSLTYNNHVKITGLLPNMKYYYMPLDMLQDQFTRPPYSFTTSRLPGDMTPYTIAVVIDMGTFGPEGLYTSAGKGVSPNNILAPGEKTTIDSLVSMESQFDFLMHPGDIAYADTWLKEELSGFINVSIADGYKAYESILDGFYNEMTPITTVKPYMVAPGNHEANCDNGGTGGYNYSICMPGQSNFTGYVNHFRMPSDESKGLGNMWYSFDHGMVHYVMVDSETDLGNGLLGPSEGPTTNNAGPFGAYNQQYNWLVNDLASVDRSKTPWVIMAGHRPWYSSGSVCTPCQAAFEPLLNKYNVDLHISGHFHTYERNDPVTLNGTSDPKGLNNPSSPWYIVNGAAGHYDGLDSFTLPLKKYQRFGLDTNSATYGWSRLTFHNCTHMTHDFIAANNNSVLDSATLFKDRKCGGGAVVSSSSSTISGTVRTSVSSAVSTGMYGNSTTTMTTTKGTGSSASTMTSKGSSGPSGSAAQYTTSTAYTTKVYTITACPTTVTNCPAASTKVVTSTIALYTTVCPVTPIPSASSAAAKTGTTSIPAAAAGSSSASNITIYNFRPFPMPP